MSYCLVADVEILFKNIDFTTSTSVLTADVEALIDLNSAVMDGRVSSRYVTPITGAESLKIMKRVCSWLTAADVDEIIRKGSVSADERVTRAETYRKMAYDILDKIESGELLLADASSSSADVFVNKLYNDAVEPEVDKDKVQW